MIELVCIIFLLCSSEIVSKTKWKFDDEIVAEELRLSSTGSSYEKDDTE